MHSLASQTMGNYLQSISFKWISSDCEAKYFRALRCPKSFRKFWKAHKEWQQNVGDAISKCLDALEETGIDADSGALSALWVDVFDQDGDSDGESAGLCVEDEDPSAPGPASPKTLAPASVPHSEFCEEHIMTLFRSEHTWTGFLQDSAESLTMAVVTKSCFELPASQSGGRRCSSQQTMIRGFPVLQTSLKLNEAVLKEKLRRELACGDTMGWNAHELEKGTSFCLGNQGTLKVLASSTEQCPVIVKWISISAKVQEVKNVAVNEKLLVKSEEMHHREDIGGSWGIEPVPILIMSTSTEVESCVKRLRQMGNIGL